MKRSTLKLIFTVLFALIFITALLGISWIGTCGIIYLVTLCFDLTFKWSVATGIWLVLLLLGGVFKSNITVKK